MTGGPVEALPEGQPRAALVREVAAALSMLTDGARVVVACSGGPDSTALAFLVSDARPDLVLHLVHVAHGLREPADETSDAALVVQHGRWLPAEVRTVEVVVERGGGGPEAAARTARYAALAEVADDVGAVAILVGHTADDQAETLLLRAARGTGLDGLAGMSPQRGRVLRPLLRLRRSDVHAFVAGEGLPAAHDASNDDPRVRRSIVRHRVLPALTDVAPDPVGALTRLAAGAAADADALARAAVATIPLSRFGDVTVLQRPALRRAHEALARRRVRDALEAHLLHPPTSATVERVLAAEPGTRLTLPGALDLQVTRGVLAFTPRAAPLPEPRSLVRPGATPWPALGAVLLTRTAGVGAAADDDGQLDLGLPVPWSPRPLPAEEVLVLTGARRERVQVVLPALAGRLELRPVRPGDRVRTAAGTRRLAAVLRDSHVPHGIRQRLPVLVAGERVLWLPGHAVDAEVAAAGRTEAATAIALVRADGTAAPVGH